MFHCFSSLQITPSFLYLIFLFLHFPLCLTVSCPLFVFSIYLSHSVVFPQLYLLPFCLHPFFHLSAPVKPHQLKSILFSRSDVKCTEAIYCLINQSLKILFSLFKNAYQNYKVAVFKGREDAGNSSDFEIVKAVQVNKKNWFLL